MSAMHHRDVTALADIPPRISALGHTVLQEIAARTNVTKDVVLQAMLLTSLGNQRALMSNIEKLRTDPGSLG